MAEQIYFNLAIQTTNVKLVVTIKPSLSLLELRIKKFNINFKFKMSRQPKQQQLRCRLSRDHRVVAKVTKPLWDPHSEPVYIEINDF